MIAIVIPCFNEASRLDTDAFTSFLADQTEVELIFVDDGSTDGTGAVIEKIELLSKGRATAVRLQKNRGKAEAVRQGISVGLKRPASHVGYWDADLATPLSEIPSFIRLAAGQPERRMVCGARIQRLGSDIQRHWYRHYPGRVIATCISVTLGLQMYDTQCGAKLIERELAGEIFSEPFISPWLFDVELIARIISLVGRQEASQTILEYPLPVWTDVGDSKVPLSYLPRIPVELLRIYLRYHRQLRQ